MLLDATGMLSYNAAGILVAAQHADVSPRLSDKR